MVRLGVNIDHVATIRQQRRGVFPSPVEAALVAQAHGASSIVAHLREDRRHIQDHDVFELKEKLKIPLSLEMGTSEDVLEIAFKLQPQSVCLVPEKRQELTTEGGLDVVSQEKRYQGIVQQFQDRKIKVSLFLDPDLQQIACAKRLGVEAIELHTGGFADALAAPAQQRELEKLQTASAEIVRLGIHLHAGHGLNYDNVVPIARIPGMEELNIGFAIIGRSIFDGLGPAVKRMHQLINADK